MGCKSQKQTLLMEAMFYMNLPVAKHFDVAIIEGITAICFYFVNARAFNSLGVVEINFV